MVHIGRMGQVSLTRAGGGMKGLCNRTSIAPLAKKHGSKPRMQRKSFVMWTRSYLNSPRVRKGEETCLKYLQY